MTLRILSRRAALIAATTLAIAGTSTIGWAQTAAPRVKLGTSAGDIVVELYPDKAPKTVENFLQYVNDKHYDGTIFHRVIDGFMIQGGGFTSELRQKPTRAPIPLEAKNGLKNDKYTIAMARTSDPNSATSQFFINVKDNASLNAPSPDGYGYTVFGKVVSGTEVVDKIRAARTGNKGGMQDVPLETITIQSATVVAK
ncbi:peptidylprolyl isomerase [Variovorax ureilyticus]|uniref:peptidylprolyl isomerase n=1 Tax=Variovorax ureilyticus TaxID=1836198 RepID=UPI003D66A499